MKLSFEDKLEIYHLRKEGYSWPHLSKKFDVNQSNLKYMVSLMDKHGVETVKKGKNRYYPPELKKEMIDRVPLAGESALSVSLEYALPNRGTLPNWIADFKKNGYTIVEKTRRKSVKMAKTKASKPDHQTELERLKDEVEYLRTENAYPKKVEGASFESRSQARTKTEVIKELLEENFQLKYLLLVAKLARSIYYYHLKKLELPDKDSELRELIKEIFNEHKGNYGYRRITMELRNQGYLVNHKKVQRIMKELRLEARIRRNRKKYSSYKGEIGKKADNLIQRQFEADRPYEKCYTDVTEFAIPSSEQKLYLSPILDGYNSEIISHTLSTSPNLKQVKDMLEAAFPDGNYGGCILHSDQGWQYQHNSYHSFLESKGVRPSMSRKGNSTDNGMMESFFGVLKTEMFYGYESSFKSIDELIQAISDYIDYYNNKRIKVKLKGLSPVQYRIQSFQ
ncbi:IS3 family transposase [Streptococcus danieliae]|uniref:IS3 family transposase n=1 Tax=Streptococcus danieliae TaxID=747656 RepID=UPI0026F23423|nr:IS3 family transposase [Streptococcus danieliae]